MMETSYLKKIGTFMLLLVLFLLVSLNVYGEDGSSGSSLLEPSSLLAPININGIGNNGSSGFDDYVTGVGGDGAPGGIGTPVGISLNAGDGIQSNHNNIAGISATSLGGRGGDGGFGLGSIDGVGVGGNGGRGGDGGRVSIYCDGGISTNGYGSDGIFALSRGGNGGNGGGAGGLFVAVGGDGSAGGNGGAVYVKSDTDSTIRTHGNDACGIVAASLSGDGGQGGNSGGIFTGGGAGSASGRGSAAIVDNYGGIWTRGQYAYGIYAESVGGFAGGGGSTGGLISFGGGATAGGDGGAAEVYNYGTITTGDHSGDPDLFKGSHALFAQSVGGSGGSAGSAGGLVAIGGTGQYGGNGDTVTVENDGTLLTYGTKSYGIYAQSIGGGGGDGGGSGGLVSIGGSGEAGGNGGSVTVDNNGSIQTFGADSRGIYAQSVGGGGGNGGASIAAGAYVSLAVGGSAGTGGNGASVNVTSGEDATITTGGNHSYGIMAQSVGGGGGTGGFAVSAAAGKEFALTASVGGTGGSGGNGASVLVESDSDISTLGSNAHGIFAQSIGGGGGDGGFTVAASGSVGISGSIAIGGGGGSGGNGSSVTVVNEGDIKVQGADAYGILGQSVGGGGGDGGFSVTAAAGKFAVPVTLGGSGGSAGIGGIVDLRNDGDITTEGARGYGILAQSIGGGGGAGGSAISLGASAAGGSDTWSVSASFGLGGSGGSGNIGNAVTVSNMGRIITWGNDAIGINAQSIGGGGGDGGSSLTFNLGLNAASDGRSVAAGISVGGDGGSGNIGGNVTVNTAGDIFTYGDRAYGIYAQSIGGGGGDGGDSRAITLLCGGAKSSTMLDKLFTGNRWTFRVSLGGDGGSGNNGGQVSVNNDGNIVTVGDLSYGIYAQSIGGGGGDGGAGILGTGTAADLAFMLAGKVGQLNDLSVAVGGKGGNNCDANSVTLNNTGGITTNGYGSIGILAQSIGGGGGVSQFFAQGEGEGGAASIGFTGKIGLGGGSGASGNGNTVRIDNSGTIETWGNSAYGILAQSIGGGGGLAGDVDRGLKDYINFGYGLGFGQDGGCGGNGGTVTINNTGDITTHGDGAIGIYAQSVGGGGGLAGDQGIGPNFSGSTGGKGSAGTVNIVQTGDIMTYGDTAHGIFAQSTGGQSGNGYLGTGGAVEISVTSGSNIYTYGQDSDGLFAQSRGAAGNGNIEVFVEKGATVQGGTGDGQGVRFVDGNQNTLTNYGVIMTPGSEGSATNNYDPNLVVVSGTGGVLIDNYGTIAGSIDLRGDRNAIFNFYGGMIDSGSWINLGNSSGLLTNGGQLSPGGIGRVQTTAITGNLTLAETSKLNINMDVQTIRADRLDISGTAMLGGDMNLSLLRQGWILPGEHEVTLMTSQDGITDNGLTFVYRPSAVIGYQLVIGPAEAVLHYGVDFSPVGLNANQTSLGDYFNVIQTAGGTDGLAPLVSDLVDLPDVSSLGRAYDELSPYAYDDTTRAAMELNMELMQFLQHHMSAVRFTLMNHEDQPGENNFWLNGFHQDGDFTSAIPLNNAEISMTGKSVGMDHYCSDRGLIGLEISSGHVGLNSGANNVDDIACSLYGFSWLSGRTYIEGTLSCNSLNFKNQRDFMAGSRREQAFSSHDGHGWGASVGGGYVIPADSWFIETSVGVEYFNQNEEGFTERGAGPVDLIVRSRHTNALFAKLGVNATREFKKDFGSVIPDIGVTHIRNLGYHGRDITASFTDYPGASFVVEGEPLSDCFALDAGLSVVSTKGLTIRLGYMNEWSDSNVIGDWTLSVNVRF